MYFSLNLRPPGSSLSGSVPSRHLLGAVGVNYRGSPQCSIVQKLLSFFFFFFHSPGFQSCLWKRFPPESSLSGSVPSRHLYGAVAVYYRGSPQYSTVQLLFWGKSFPHSLGSQSCLWERFPPEITLSGSVPSRHLYGAVAVSYRGFPQCSIVQQTILGEIFSPLARVPELSLGALPPREHALGFGTITASSWRCSGLLPGLPSIRSYSKLFWGKSFLHSPGSQSCLWERFPPESTLSVRYHHGIFLAL